MNNNFDSKENHAGRYSSSSPANDRQRAVSVDVHNYTPIKGLIYFTVFTALSFSILVFALAPQLRVDDQNVNSLSGIAQPVSQAITKQAAPATELAETSGSVEEIKSTGEQVSVQEPVDGSANVPTPLPEASVSALELAKTEPSEELAPELGIQFPSESKNHTEEVLEVTERLAQQSEPMTPLGIELAAIVDFDAENQSMPESISDIESTVYIEETTVQQTELAAPVESVVPVEAQHIQQIERIQSELTAVTGSDKEVRQGGEPASSHNSLEHIDADSGQGSRPLQTAKTELVQVAAVGVIQQSQLESANDTESVARIDEESVEQPKPAVPVLEPIATELAAIVDFDAENQSLPESISDIESTVYFEETPVQQTELAALEPESLEMELAQVAESMTDDRSLDKLAVPVELVVQVEAQHEQQIEQVLSELVTVTGFDKEAQHSGVLASEREEQEFIEIEPVQISRESQPVTTQLVQVAAVGFTQQSQIESISNTESVARIGEKSVDHSQPAVPTLKMIVTELAALKDFSVENKSFTESVSDIDLAADVGELFGSEPALLETEAKQVAESVIDDQRFGEQSLSAESTVKVESETGQSSRELQPITTHTARAADDDIVQQNHIEPISDTELAVASESETNDEGLGGPITDYEQALQVDPQPNQQSQPDVTVLEPVSGEEKLVPTGEAEPVILLSTDLESLANAPVVLTESNVRPGPPLCECKALCSLDT